MTKLLARLRPSRDELIDAAFALGLVAVALWAFQSAFGGVEFFIVGVIAAVIGLAVTHVCRRFDVSVIITVGVWFVTYILIGGVLANRAEALGGLLPSPDTVFAAVRTMVRGWKELLTTVPPVGRTGDLLALPVFCGIFATGSGYLLARRRDWTIVPAIPALAVMGLGILCGTEEPVSVLLHGGVMALGLVVWASIRSHRTRPSLDAGLSKARRLAAGGVLLAVAAFAGLALGGSVPFAQARDRMVWRDTFEPPFDPSVYPSPLGYYRQYVKELATEPLFDITGIPDGVPIRMATLDTYDGIVWKVTGGTRALRGSAGYFERVGTEVDPNFGRADTTVTVTFPENSAYDEVWLPTVGEAESVSFSGSGERSRELADAYRYNRTTDTAAVLGDPRPGDAYDVTVAIPPSLADLPDDAQFAENNLEPIEGIPGPVSGLGSGLVEEVDGLERVQILADFLSDGYYSDSSSGQSPVPAGHGAGRLLQFADATELVGNAEQYAATLGLILRNSGIPARVVMGFVPKEHNAEDTVTVTGEDAEAWVEVLVEDAGWVPVFPTPDRTRTTVVKDDTPKPIPDRETQVPPPPPIIEPDAETDPASDTAQTERRPKDDRKPVDEVAGAGTPWLVVAGLSAVVFPVLVFTAILGSILMLKRRRRNRRLRAARRDERMANGWRELVDYAVDTGQVVPSFTTRREAAAIVAVPNATLLAQRADAAVFSGCEPTDDEVTLFWREVREAKESLRGDLGLIDRVKAAVSLESFRRAKGERRAAERRFRRVERETRRLGSEAHR